MGRGRVLEYVLPWVVLANQGRSALMNRSRSRRSFPSCSHLRYRHSQALAAQLPTATVDLDVQMDHHSR